MTATEGGFGNGDRTANEHVLNAIRLELASGSEIGVQVAAYRDGELIIDCWAGLADIERNVPVGGETLFNVFSVTKAVVATALHIQVNRGLVEYDAPIAQYWPEFARNGKEGVTVRDAVTHRTGVPQMPNGVTPALMANWDWMIGALEGSKPLTAPGTATYQALTFGWLVGEIVRRSDPAHRSIGEFVRDEIGNPLGAPDLWIGLPSSELPRVAKLYDTRPPTDYSGRGDLYSLAVPSAVDLVPSVFEQEVVRHNAVPGVGGIFTARSEAKFWTMLAQGGELDGNRLLSAASADRLFTPRRNSDEPDRVMYNIPLNLSEGGFWLGSDRPAVWSMPYSDAICHPGAGNSFGWADRQTHSAAAICHNRMSAPRKKEDDSTLKVAQAIRQAMGVR